MDCVSCKTETKKYKCPVCRQPYCSVECFKKHKETPCVAPQENEHTEEQKPTSSTYEYPTEDTVPIEKLQLLRQSKELKTCLENPHLRTILEKLDQCERPDRMIKDYMQEPIFTEFVDACLSIVEPKNTAQY